jgi:uncharacterized protein YbjQ (UPF0145 family)
MSPGTDRPPPPDRLPEAPYVTTLSVNEFVLLWQAGFRPLGLVLGCSVYRVTDPGRRPAEPHDERVEDGARELVAATQALYSARQRAMTRLEEEADRIGADGVIGLRVTREDGVDGDELAHFTAFGTAIRADAPAPSGSWRNARDVPFTSTLTGQDFWTLLRAGHAPVGVVLGASSYPAVERARRPWPVRLASGDPEQDADEELAEHTQLVYTARARALDRLREEAAELVADGVVDLRVSGLTDPLRPGRVEVLAIGTAVRRLRAGRPPWPEPTPVLPLSDG